MITQLPQWVWGWTWVLAFVAGIINVVGFMGFEHQAVTHLTGTTSLLGAAISNANTGLGLHLIFVIGSFMFGAALSGAIIKDGVLKLGRRYGLVLLIESMALVLAVPLLSRGSAIGTYLAGAACGLQNAMASTYSGTVIRTSHVTGMFTDLGIFIGHALRGVPIEKRRLHLSLIVISGFLTGGILGSLLFRSMGYPTLYIAAFITSSLAFIYAVYRLSDKRRASLDLQ